MKKSSITFCVLFLSITSFVSAQDAAFDLFNTSRFARAIRLGNAYTGVAEGPEALYYNAAGIADQSLYSFTMSGGQGLGLFVHKTSSYDYALIVPLSGNLGTIGLSVNKLSYYLDVYETNESIYNINYAKKLSENFSAGMTVSYYKLNFPNLSAGSDNEPISGSAFDLNLSALYKLPGDFNISDKDKFQIGLQIKNILNTKVKYDDFPQDDYKFQNIRLGLSYSYNSGLEPIFNLSPLKFMLAFDAVLNGTDYEFKEWQPNYGLELTLFEILELSFGRENEIQIEETYSYSPQYPVNRYGFGINIPFSSQFKMKFDYSISDWQKIDEEKGRSEFYSINKSIDKHAVSVSVFADL